MNYKEKDMERRESYTQYRPSFLEMETHLINGRKEHRYCRIDGIRHVENFIM
jgi:hypothetical protein